MASSRFPFWARVNARIRSGNYELLSAMCKHARKFYTCKMLDCVKMRSVKADRD